MRSDPEIKEDIDAELRWSPEVDETDIATKVKDGIVTVTGAKCVHGRSATKRR